MLKNLMSKLAAATDDGQQWRQQSRTQSTQAVCVMEAVEDRLLMASDYLYGGGDLDGSDVRPMESLSLNFTRGSTVGFVIYGK